MEYTRFVSAGGKPVMSEVRENPWPQSIRHAGEASSLETRDPPDIITAEKDSLCCVVWMRFEKIGANGQVHAITTNIVSAVAIRGIQNWQ